MTSQSSTHPSIAFSEANGTYPYSITPVSGFDANPSSGTLTVNGAAVEASISFSSTAPAQFSVTFTESGLPASTSWSVKLGGNTGSATSASISFTETNGTYTFSVSPVAGYTSSPGSGSLVVSGSAVGEPIEFTPIPPPGTYPITFTQSGLTAGTVWTVTLDTTPRSSSDTTITFDEVNGSSRFSVDSVRGFIESPSGGPVSVIGDPVSISILFTNSTPPSNGSEFPVSFFTTGLPSDAQWSILMLPGPGPYQYNSTEFGVEAQGSSLSVGLPNGTYAWFLGYNPSGFLPNSTNGTIVVAGHPVNRTIAFQLLIATGTTYSVTFAETGLPSSGTWFVTANVTAKSAPTGTPVGFQFANGTYSYNVSVSARGYSSNGEYGTYYVDGGPVSVVIHFDAVYNVTFLETGVSNATSWVVDLNGSEDGASAGYPIVYPLFNGTYSYSVWAPGYAAHPASGTLTVAGGPQNVSITFHPSASYPVRFSETGLPVGGFWIAELMLNGSTFANGTLSAGSMANVTAGPGNYTWTAQVEPFSGIYVATPDSGGITIRASPVNVTVAFASVGIGLQVVVFTEEDELLTGSHGGPNGTTWNVTLDGVTKSTSGVTIAFLEPNGTFAYTVGGPTGYVPLPSFGTFTIDEASPSSAFNPAVSVYIAFTPGYPPLQT